MIFLIQQPDLADLYQYLGSIPIQSILEWVASVSGLLGAFLLATHSDLSKYGWVAYLIANIAMIFFAFSIKANALLIQQFGFMLTTAWGIYKSRPWQNASRC